MSEAGEILASDRVRPKTPKGRVREAARTDYRLEPHVCKRCMGRVASFWSEQTGERVHECTNCGHQGGAKAESMCCCGIKIRKGGRHGTGKQLIDAGIRCHENHERTEAFPALYVASYLGGDPKG